MSTKSRQVAISAAKSLPGAFSDFQDFLKTRQAEISHLKSRLGAISWTF
jgi:hypothetical protein